MSQSKKIVHLSKSLKDRFSNKQHRGNTSSSMGVNSSDLLFDDRYYTHPIQLDIVGSLYSNLTKKTQFPIQFQCVCEQITRHINTKVSSYQMQDKLKKRELTDQFVKRKDIITMLKDCNLTCHYCLEHVFIVYKNNQEMLQWTLDRLDNSISHTKENVVISCLKCNLKKGRKNEDDFIFTKQLTITKRESDDIEDIQKKDEIYEDACTDEMQSYMAISDIEYSQDV